MKSMACGIWCRSRKNRGGWDPFKSTISIESWGFWIFGNPLVARERTQAYDMYDSNFSTKKLQYHVTVLPQCHNATMTSKIPGYRWLRFGWNCEEIPSSKRLHPGPSSYVRSPLCDAGNRPRMALLNPAYPTSTCWNISCQIKSVEAEFASGPTDYREWFTSARVGKLAIPPSVPEWKGLGRTRQTTRIWWRSI